MWEVSASSPCSSPRVAKKLYFNKDTRKYYSNYQMTVIADGYFFSSENTLDPYAVITNGEITQTTGCPVTITLRKSDMGIPTDISKFGNLLLCAYADKHVVMLYDTSTGTNPIGTIVAGQMNNPQTGYDMGRELLNMPMLVQWRDTGGFFAVYSGGSFKSVKIFNQQGYRAGGSQVDDDEWAYKPVEGGGVNNANCVPLNPGSLVDLLTAKDSSLNGFWLPVTLQYVEKTGDGAFDAIVLGIWNKSSDNYNYFKTYAISLVEVDYFGNSRSLTSGISTHSGLRDGDVDMIRSFAVTRKKAESHPTPKYKAYSLTLTVVAPRSWTVGGNDRYKNYEVEEVIVWMVDRPNVISDEYRSPGIEPKSIKYKGRYRINSNSNNVWKNNVKAEIAYNGQNLIVVIKSSSVSQWARIKSWATLASVEAVWITSTVVTSLSSVATGGFFTVFFPLAPIAGSPAGVVIAIVAVLLYFLLKPPVMREVGTSKLWITYSGENSSIGWESGAVEAKDWINNDLRKWRTTYLDSNVSSGDLRLYSLREDGSVQYGNWNAGNSSGTLLE
ncbi:hypothetical protein [Pedobacter steynii]|uniref:Uncharacterized protein n=1 Tax=Pedobacter steynii TaxID=430522 RepID=A0A1D7QBM2_9SPHI|nr:hypothetical protein [Pedobacter steynii]AOM75989.1 hypothetical protein BFS30_01710 [Pedobacter steynii]